MTRTTWSVTRVVGVSLVCFVWGGCGGGSRGDDDSSDDDAGGAGRSHGGSSAGTASGSGGKAAVDDGPAKCTIAHCDCSYCDFNPDYRCVDLCVETCGDSEVGFHCDGSSDCISVQSDRDRCGSCDNTCAADEYCLHGECTLGDGAAGRSSGGTGTGATGGGGNGSGGLGAAGKASGGKGSGGTGAAGKASGGTGTGGTGAAGKGSGGDAGTGSGGSADPCHDTTDGPEGSGLGYVCGANLPHSICTPDPGGATMTCSSPPKDRLFLCSKSKTAGYVDCAAGCHASGAGDPDYCEDDDPCANSPFNSDSCGTNLSPLADPDTLYTCQDGETVDSQVCDGGCAAAPLGQTDQCAPVEQGSD
jgi:hypothetical protein